MMNFTKPIKPHATLWVVILLLALWFGLCSAGFFYLEQVLMNQPYAEGGMIRLLSAGGYVMAFGFLWVIFLMYTQSQHIQQKVQEKTAELASTHEMLKIQIEERLSAAGAFRSNEAKIQAIVNTAMEGILLVNPEGKIDLFNPAAEKIFGYSQSEILGSPVDILFPACPGFSTNACFHVQSCPGQKNFSHYEKKRFPQGHHEICLQTKQKQYFLAHFVSHAIDLEGAIFYAVIVHDITQKKADEEAKARSEAKNRAMLSAIPDMIFELDGKGCFTDFRINELNNARFLPPHFLGRSFEACLETSVSQKMRKAMQHVERHNGIEVVEYFHLQEEEIFWHEARIVRCGDDAYLMMIRDVTQRKKDELELLQHRDHLADLVFEQTAEMRKAKEAAEQANRAKSEFLANMSHELRTPMHAMLSFAQMGLRKSEGLEPHHRYFDRIYTSGQRLLTILNDLLDLSKLEAGKMLYDMSQQSLQELVKTILDEFEQLALVKKCKLRVDFPPHPLVYEVDSLRILQVLRNLFGNALKFSPEGGTIHLSLEGGAGMPLKVRIEDEGPGIPETELNSIFEKFIQSSQTKTGAGGTGLGLAICREIVVAHGGQISARNRPEGGAAFLFSLPPSSFYSIHSISEPSYGN